MDLNIQLVTLLISFLYGIFFSICLDINYHFFRSGDKWYKILLSFVFIIVNVLLYFILLKKFNNGILHMYGVFAIIIGVLLEHFITKTINRLFTLLRHK